MLSRVLPSVFAAVAAASLAGCSPKQIGISRMAEALSATTASYSADNDPEFVRLAAPSTLKMVEMLLESQPAHEGMLMTACSGFTQYSYGFLQLEAEIARPSNPSLAAELRARGRNMYDRARDYCLRVLEARHSGLRAALVGDPTRALQKTTTADVPALFWLAASWGGALSLAENQLTRLGELVVVRVLLMRALALDETWEHGTIHEAFIALDGLPPLLGGSAARARQHFNRAVALSGGASAFAYVTMASSVAVPAKDRAEFETLLKSALAIDINRRPALRLANLIAQRRARFLLSRANQMFKIGAPALGALRGSPHGH